MKHFTALRVLVLLSYKSMDASTLRPDAFLIVMTALWFTCLADIVDGATRGNLSVFGGLALVHDIAP